MTVPNADEFRARLLAMRKELESLAAAGEDSAAIVELDQARVGRLSRMDAMQAQAMAEASGRRREDKLMSITSALQRIDDDEYGFCTECGGAINPKRLEFDPTVLHCIDCASRKEQRE